MQGTLYGGTGNGPNVFHQGEIQTLTDADGQYRLEGLEPIQRTPRGMKNLLVLPPRSSNYLSAATTVNIRGGGGAVVNDVGLHRGIRVCGRALDGRTRQPVLGTVHYRPFADNPAAKAAADFTPAILDHYYYQTDSDGRFVMPVLPGKGVLSFAAMHHRDYPAGVGFEEVQAAAGAVGSQNFALLSLRNHQVLKVVDLEPDAKEATVDFTLRSSATITGRAVTTKASS